MPKLKTKGSCKNRFKVTKNGKVKCSKPGKGHQRAIHSGKDKRALREKIVLTGTWAKLVKKMLGV